MLSMEHKAQLRMWLVEHVHSHYAQMKPFLSNTIGARLFNASYAFCCSLPTISLTVSVVAIMVKRSWCEDDIVSSSESRLLVPATARLPHSNCMLVR